MHILIVGGSDAGISAALRAKECAPSAEVAVLLADRYPNFSICGLPFYVSGEVSDWQALAHRSETDLAQRGIRLLLDHRVVSIDATFQFVVAHADGTARTFPYDRLIIGTGALPTRPPIEGFDGENVFVLHTMDDSFLLTDRVSNAASAIIIGGGYIGVEMADALRHRGLRVTLIERLPMILATVDPEIGQRVMHILADNGCDVVTDTTVDAIVQRAGGVRVTAGSRSWNADLALLVVGVQPASELAASAGAALGDRGAIRVDRQMRTTLPNVFAAGDCVETWHRLLNRNTYLPLGTTSHKQGRVAGENAVGGSAMFAGVLGSQAVKIFDYVVAGTGLTEARAREAGFDCHVVDSTYDDHKAYYPGASPVRIRIVGDRSTHALLGAQMIGRYGAEVAKRIDVFATALHNAMSIDDLSELDLTYTPPLSSPWDPVQMAAQSWMHSRRAVLAV